MNQKKCKRLRKLMTEHAQEFNIPFNERLYRFLKKNLNGNIKNANDFATAMATIMASSSLRDLASIPDVSGGHDVSINTVGTGGVDADTTHEEAAGEPLGELG